jgi:hypothetical protein
VNEFVVFAFLLIPLVMELHFPASFTKFLAFFTLGFISILTLGTITAMEIPTSIVPESGLFLKDLLLLFLGSCFAFFGHNIIPRVRMILRDKAQTKKVFYTAISIVFLLYLPFAVSVAGTGITGIATKHLAELFSGPLGALIEISAVIIFYTSFVIFGLHTLGEFGFNLKGLALMLSMVVAAYYITMMFGMNFQSVICFAGFLVTLYTGIASVTAIKSGTEVKFAYYLLVLTVLMWAGLVAALFA